MDSEVARLFGGSIPLSLLSSQGISTPQDDPYLSPQLVILKHKTHAEEIVSRNGIQKTIHLVVKNSPFTYQLGVTNASVTNTNFNQLAFEAHLLYDCEGEKEVDFIKQKPLEFKSQANDAGDKLDTEIRIKVLTSQHEDMLFKVKIQGYHPITRQPVPGMYFLTSPIKVISKPEQIKKSKAVVPSAPANPASKKRTITETLAETVARIEKQQEEQQRIIAKLLQQQVDATQNLDSKKQKTQASENAPVAMPAPPAVSAEVSKKPDFEEAFVALLNSFGGMTEAEKPDVVRRLIRNSSARDTQRLSELLDLFWTEGLQKEVGRCSIPTEVTSSGCRCNNCPHKVELQRIDEFYKDFLTSGVALAPHQI